MGKLHVYFKKLDLYFIIIILFLISQLDICFSFVIFEEFFLAKICYVKLIMTRTKVFDVKIHRTIFMIQIYDMYIYLIIYI